MNENKEFFKDNKKKNRNDAQQKWPAKFLFESFHRHTQPYFVVECIVETKIVPKW